MIKKSKYVIICSKNTDHYDEEKNNWKLEKLIAT